MKFRVEKLRRSYEASVVKTVALNEISFTVEEGEFLAIVGRSGSGKTTLLNCLGGLDTNFEGQVHLGEVGLRELSEASLARLRQSEFGFVFQHFNLLGHLTVLENVLLPTFFSGASVAKSREKARQLLARVGLGQREASMPSELSGGQRQRVAIARALINNPSVLLCDEPTGSLDRRTGHEIMRLFAELNEVDGITLILITHEPYIASMARREIRMEEGEIVVDRRQEPVWPTLDTDGVGAP